MQNYANILLSSELLEFIDSLPAPELFGRPLGRCDEEFLQLHSDFIVSQVLLLGLVYALDI